MWRELGEKANLEKNPKRFWRDVRRMMGKSRGKRPKIFKDEKGRVLSTDGEVRAAFKNRLMRTFNISDEENQD